MTVNNKSQFTTIRCLQINMQHAKAAALHLSQLLIDMNIDIVFIQEPYALSQSNVSLKYIPDHFVQLHSLSHDHAFGAAILAKRSLNPSLLPLEISNCAAGAKIIIHDQPLFLFSVYFRPSLIDLKSFLYDLSRSLTPEITSRSILCFDANARNSLWNSNLLDSKGIIFEDFCRSLGLNIINAALSNLNHHPPNSTFPDITIAGDLVNISEWNFPDIPSMSDHPLISFSVNINRINSNAPKQQNPRAFPRLSVCSTDMFLESLDEGLTKLPVLNSTSTNIPPASIDYHTTCLVSLLQTCAVKSRLPHHPSMGKAKMPWWNKELWALRHQLRRAYQAKCSFPSDENAKSYRNIKSKYQQQIRARKTQSWREFCSSNLNSDLFSPVKNIANASSNNCPPPLIKIDGMTSVDPNQMLAAFNAGGSFFPKNTPSSPLQLVFTDKVRNEINEPLKSFTSITDAEVICALTSLKPNQSAGIDGCPAEWLKCGASRISKHVTTLFNACLAFSQITHT